ncbi:MAG: hypothetical protein FWB97_04895, partial [Oscillospiraceae bacterium]|nr:hypothetical protein [Oscillospiraceae bacterium]
MIRKTLNKIFSSKVFYVIFALLVAGALWMYVEITENQEQSHRVADVPIVFRNADILRDRGLLITNKEPQSLVLTFEVPLNVANQLSNSTVFAEVNLANVTRAGHITEDYTIIFPSGINPNTTQPVQRSVERISLLIDRLSARTIPVRGEYTGGTAADDLFAAPVEFEPQTITVEGPD